MNQLTILVFSAVFAAEAVAMAAGPYPIRVAPDHRHVIDQDGRPFLIQGDAPWSLLTAVTKEEAELYLEDRRRKGFNSIIVNLIEHKFHGPVNRYGDGPFTTPGDFAQPNEAYFAHADWVIRKAGEKGIQVLLAPIYLGYVGTDDGWVEEALKNAPAKCRDWGRFVGKRYAGFDNIVWLIGGDRNPAVAREDVDAVALGIKEMDKRHLMAAHCHPENSALDQYQDSGWLDLNTTYTYETVHHKLVTDYHRQPPMPFFLIESTYEGEHNASAVQIRRQSYWAVLCGAAGQIMGNRPVWLFDPGWQTALDAAGSRDMARLYALFQSRPWHDLVPDLDHTVVLDGLGEFNGMDYLAAARTSDGATVMAYMPSARTVTVDMAKVSGKAAASWWFNPRTGKSQPAGQFPTAGRRRFTPPGPGDWVLVLDDISRRPKPAVPVPAS